MFRRDDFAKNSSFVDELPKFLIAFFSYCRADFGQASFFADQFADELELQIQQQTHGSVY